MLKSRIQKMILISALCQILGIVSAQAGPLGKTGKDGVWKAEWTRAFKQCFEKYGQDLASLKPTPSDYNNYCMTKPKDPANFWFSIFLPLAHKESRFVSDASGQNGAKVPLGLFQMDANDMKSHNCKGLNGETVNDPTNPIGAICCAVQIANNQVTKKNASKISDGENGIMSAFWQPMREGMGGDGRGGKNNINNSANLKGIQDVSKKMCENNPVDREEDLTNPFSEGGGSGPSSSGRVNSGRSTR